MCRDRFNRALGFCYVMAGWHHDKTPRSLVSWFVNHSPVGNCGRTFSSLAVHELSPPGKTLSFQGQGLKEAIFLIGSHVLLERAGLHYDKTNQKFSFLVCEPFSSRHCAATSHRWLSLDVDTV